ncbi:MAG: restriction endonuclease subunit S [Ruminococcus sp.]|nr:restriction endonuclease subunit S [Ruminococcus sp.]
MSKLNDLINKLCPEGVEFKPLGEIATIIRGPFGSSLKKECFVDNGYVVYEQQHAIYSELLFRYYIDSEKFKELKRFEVRPDDLIVSCSGTIGKVMIIPENAPQGIINQALLKLTPNKNITSKFLKYCFENTVSTILNDKAHGGAIKNVPSVSELKQIKIPAPPLEVQREIVRILDEYSEKNEELIKSLYKEIELRKKQYEYYRDKLLTFDNC